MTKTKTIHLLNHSKRRYYWEESKGISIIAKTLPKGNGVPLEEARILLVEDNSLNLKTMEVGLRKHVRSIHKATNGLEALKLCQQNQYDLILMDLQLPIMSGIKACKEIRKLEAHSPSPTPLIALTAEFYSNAKEKALRAGVNAFISKPFTVSTLLEIVKEYV